MLGVHGQLFAFFIADADEVLVLDGQLVSLAGHALQHAGQILVVGPHGFGIGPEADVTEEPLRLLDFLGQFADLRMQGAVTFLGRLQFGPVVQQVLANAGEGQGVEPDPLFQDVVAGGGHGQDVLLEVFAAGDRRLKGPQLRFGFQPVGLGLAEQLEIPLQGLGHHAHIIVALAQDHVAHLLLERQQFAFLDAQLGFQTGLLAGEDLQHLPRGALVELVHELQVGGDDAVDDHRRSLWALGLVGDLQNIRLAHDGDRELVADDLRPFVGRGIAKVHAALGRERADRLAQHDVAAEHVPVGVHEVLDHHVAALFRPGVGLVLLDQQRGLGLVDPCRGGVVEPAKGRGNRQ